MSEAWRALRGRLLAHPPLAHIPQARASLRAQHKARWERWVHARVHGASWGAKSDVGRVEWTEQERPEEAVGKALRMQLAHDAGETLEAQGQSQWAQINSSVEQADETIAEVAAQAIAAHYDAGDVTRGCARVLAMIEREEANGGEAS